MSSWKHQGNTVEELPEGCEAFVYLITNLTNDMKYVGKKLAKFKLHFCPSRGVASYLEAREQFERRVLETDEYYNGIINVRVGGSQILKEALRKNKAT